jgi:hypothetical protein
MLNLCTCGPKTGNEEDEIWYVPGMDRFSHSQVGGHDSKEEHLLGFDIQFHTK